MSNDPLANVFVGVENAKALGGFTSRLPIGSFTLLLKRFNVKESAKGKGKIVEADFHVLTSSVPEVNPNETKGWAWFIGSTGFAGDYEQSRLQTFIQTVSKSIGDTSSVSQMGTALAGQAQAGRGLTMACTVSAQANRDGSPKKSPKGEIYTEINWTPVPQGIEAITAGRRKLDGGDFLSGSVNEPAVVLATPEVAASVAAVAAPAGAGVTSLLSRLSKPA